MSAFNRRVWRAKPPMGTPLASGLWAPDRIALPFNEISVGNGFRNYAVPPSQAVSASISNAVGIVQTRDGPGPTFTNNNQNLFLTQGCAIIPTDQVTFLIGFAKRDTTNRAATTFGINTGGGAGRGNAYVPFSDGIVYWDWNGTVSGTNRLTISGLTFGGYDIWAFTTGPRGMEIWRNGSRIATNSATPVRSAVATNDFLIGSDGGNGSDLVDWDFFYCWSTQLPEAKIQQLSVLPFSVFESHRPRVFGIATATATGDLSETLADATISANGTVGDVGTLSETLGAVTLSGAGTAPVLGTLSKTLDAVTSSAAGTAPVTGILSETLGAVTDSGAGTAPASGNLSEILADATILATGSHETEGDLAVTLEIVTVSASGTVSDAGSLTKTLDLVTISAAGTIPVVGVLNKTLDAATILADGAESGNSVGELTVTLANVAIIASGQVRNQPLPPHLVAGNTRSDFWQTHDFPEVL